ncbi:hypothetical protein GPECTOR_49g484 [Gonium pectorale]|uniref:Uncharacterized protein n=1 Tax=Gonium pectorale TaxID=33097 RepID=A0A150G966_GONPE|nr:hypothetical protein GPECTOR_49g484 [Gonium pectorale]|eukprot:KXZ45900.1 hypothetical protein GPECTOR_49g484 [Gonium pectorale]
MSSPTARAEEDDFTVLESPITPLPTSLPLHGLPSVQTQGPSLIPRAGDYAPAAIPAAPAGFGIGAALRKVAAVAASPAAGAAAGTGTGEVSVAGKLSAAGKGDLTSLGPPPTPARQGERPGTGGAARAHDVLPPQPSPAPEAASEAAQAHVGDGGARSGGGGAAGGGAGGGGAAVRRRRGRLGPLAPAGMPVLVAAALHRLRAGEEAGRRQVLAEVERVAAFVRRYVLLFFGLAGGGLAAAGAAWLAATLWQLMAEVTALHTQIAELREEMGHMEARWHDAQFAVTAYRHVGGGGGDGGGGGGARARRPVDDMCVIC